MNGKKSLDFVVRRDAFRDNGPRRKGRIAGPVLINFLEMVDPSDGTRPNDEISRKDDISIYKFLLWTLECWTEILIEHC